MLGPGRSTPLNGAVAYRRYGWWGVVASGLIVLLLDQATLAQNHEHSPSDSVSRVLVIEREHEVRSAARDSLRQEIKRYARVVQGLRDSMVSLEGEGELNRDEEEALEYAIQEISQSLADLSEELANLDVEFTGDAISIRDGRGGTISIPIPRDLPDQITRGVGSITKALLEELPDSVTLQSPVWIHTDETSGEQTERASRRYSWKLPDRAPRDDDKLRVFGSRSGRGRIIEGDVVKVRDDLVIRADEVVRGNVVVVAGSVLVEGHVDGDLVCVAGDIQMSEDAEVDGKVVCVLGRFDRMEGAEVGSVVVINPRSIVDLESFEWGVEGGGWTSFLAWQAFFLMVTLLVLLVLALLPARRLDRLHSALEMRPGECLGLGLLVALAGHMLLGVLLAVLVVTVIGIPLAILLILGLLILDILAVAIVAVAVGRRLCGLLSLRCSRAWAMALLGLTVIHGFSFLSGLVASISDASTVAALLGLIGVSLKLIVYVYGLGALIVSRGGRRRLEARESALQPASV